jgi:hypothetical protein
MHQYHGRERALACRTTEVGKNAGGLPLEGHAFIIDLLHQTGGGTEGMGRRLVQGFALPRTRISGDSALTADKLGIVAGTLAAAKGQSYENPKAGPDKEMHTSAFNPNGDGS